MAKDHSLFVTVEENVKSGGYGEHIAAYMEACHPEVRVLTATVWDQFVPQGKVDSLRGKDWSGSGGHPSGNREQ